MSDKKIQYISFLQIIGPLFVVLGHSLNGLECSGIWYTFSKQWIYIFHMPLFFFISGYLLSFKDYLHGRSYKELVISKVKRLLFPYLFWNLLFYIPKVMVQVYLSDKAPSSLENMLKAFVYPRQNIWGHTWFLMGLFVVYLATPLFEKLLKNAKTYAKICIITICILIYILPITSEFLAFSDLHKDLLFFVMGCILGQVRKDIFTAHLKKYAFLYALLAAVFSVAAILTYEYSKFLHFIPCAFILLAFTAFGSIFGNLPDKLSQLAASSFSIYILHWPVMIVTRIILYQIFELGTAITATAMTVLGYIVPLFVIWVIRKLPWQGIKRPLKYLLGV